MINFFKPKKKEEIINNNIIKTITTKKGTRFNVFFETDHYILCYGPSNNDSIVQAIFDIEDMFLNGYELCHVVGFGTYIIFKKINNQQHMIKKEKQVKDAKPNCDLCNGQCFMDCDEMKPESVTGESDKILFARRDFESWAIDIGFNISKTIYKDYENLKLNWMWKAWKKAKGL